MKNLLECLAEKRALVSDGAWGTMLQAAGLKPGECPELWCLEHRKHVRNVARQYVEAGAELVKTNSFGGTRIKLDIFGLANKDAQINEEAAAISREAAGAGVFVLGSMGPTGKMLLMGDISDTEMYEAFGRQAEALERGGADAALIETMTALDEACLAIKAVKENTKLAAICTFTFDRAAGGEYRSMMGVAPAEMAGACVEAGADMIGSNCGNGFERMPEIVKQLAAAAPDAPIVIHANAGSPVRRGDTDVFPDTPEISASYVPAILEAGARIIGGCCGTTPAHIAAIAAVIRARRG